MLRIIQQSNATAAKSYYAHSDYYAEHCPGVWGGKGAERLGLEGEVGKAAFDALCENRDPQTGRPLTARTRADRTILYDWNFHVPKGLSLLGEMTGDPRLSDAVREAVFETMREAEADMKARVRKGKHVGERVTGNMVWAGFFHNETRPSKEDGLPDPHWHWHVCVMNATYDAAEGQWKAGQFRDLKADAPYYEAAFHARLAKRITELGYDVRRKGRGGKDWEIDGVAEHLARKFSRRTQEIEQLAEEKGVTDAAEKDSLGARSRQKKQRLLSPAALRQYWRDRLEPGEADAIAKLHEDAERNLGRMLEPDDARAAEHGIAHSFAREAVVPVRKVYTQALRFGLGRVTPEGVRAAARSQGLLTRQKDGRELATTREVLREERDLVAFARQGRGACKALAPGDHTIKRDFLDAEQRRAVESLWRSTDRVSVLLGKAGVGKTSLLKEVVEGIEQTGPRVLAFAPSSAASVGVLRSEGFADATTVAALLVDPRMQAEIRDQVLLIDEAGLLGSKTLNEVFQLAKRENARVILAGDTMQHRAVERGAPLQLLQKEAGVAPVVVRDIKRQRGEYRQSVQAFSYGRTLEGFDRLRALGWVKELADADRFAAMADDYASALREGKSVLAIAPTHAEGQHVTDAIRAELKRQGRLANAETELPRLVDTQLTDAERADPTYYEVGDVVEFHQNVPGFKRGQRVNVVGVKNEDVLVSADGSPGALPLSRSRHFGLYRPAKLSIAVGDVLRITKNGKSQDGHRMHNGAIVRVAAVGPDGSLRLDNDWRLGKEFGHVAYGYCVTSHASQGRTVDRVLISQGRDSLPAASPEQAYVSASRGRERATIYTDDQAALRKAVEKHSPHRTATELMQRSPPRLAIRRRLQRAALTLQRWHDALAERLERGPREFVHER